MKVHDCLDLFEELTLTGPSLKQLLQ